MTTQPTIAHRTQAQPAPRWFISVYFGLDHCAVSYAFDTAMPGDETVITEWLGSSIQKHLAVPAVIYYDHQSVVGWGHYKPVGFGTPGFLKHDTAVAVEHFWHHLGFFLEPAKYSAGIIPPLPVGKDAIDVSADYLLKLRMAVRDALLKALGNDLDNLLGNSIEWCFVALQSQAFKAKGALRAAIERARYLRNGHDVQFTFIPEGEASPLHCYKHGLISGPWSDAILMIACNKERVDLSAYGVLAVAPSLRLWHVTHDTGDFCGSAALARNFNDMVREKVNKLKLPRGSKTAACVHSIAAEGFHCCIRHAFDNKGQRWAMDAGFGAEHLRADIEEVSMVYSNDEILSCFQPVVASIKQLVKKQLLTIQQINRTVQKMVITGDLGTLDYVFEQIKSGVPPEFRNEVIRPAHAASAAVRGGVLAQISRFKGEFSISRENLKDLAA
ncbi:hypothetical protein ACJ41O_015358 [Fusarium nematophilum]